MSKFGAALAALFFTYAGVANALPIILDGNTTGTNFSGYTVAAGDFTSGSSTQLGWNASPCCDTLSIMTLPDFIATGAAIGLDLAELQMEVNNNPSNLSCGSCSFQYNVVLDITIPNLGSNTYDFSLNLSIPPGAGVNSTANVNDLLISDASPALPISINLGNGFALTNFGFSDTGGTFSMGTWTVTGHMGLTADLFLTADVVPVEVPEPASIAFIGGGLLALGVLHWRRRHRVL